MHDPSAARTFPPLRPGWSAVQSSPAIAAVQRVMARSFAIAAAAWALAAMLAILLLNRHLASATLVGVLTGPLTVAAGMLAGVPLLRRGRLAEGMLVVLGTSWLGVTAFALLTGLGVHTVAFGINGVIIVAAGAFISTRAALILAALCGATVVALYVGELSGALDGARALAQLPLVNRLIGHLLVIGAAVALALALTRVLVKALQRATAQEHRLTGLLSIGSDFHWTQDAEHRFTGLDSAHADRSWLPVDRYLGRCRWEVEGQTPISSDWAQHRADLDARRPFRNFVIEVRPPSGARHYISVSGEPTWDENGRFTGYWGIGRIATAEVEAQLRLHANERRYRQIFELSPSPLVVHRQGLITAANLAAARLFGYGQPADMAGVAMASLAAPAERDPALGRLAELETLPPGAAVSHGEERLRARDGRSVVVQSTAVRMEFDDGAASMSMFFDITARKQAEAAIEDARAQAEAANQAKSAFLANVTHELRTPLNGVLGLARLARDEADGGRRGRYLDHLLDSAESLRRLIDDVLDIAKIEAGKLTTERSPFDLRALLEELGAVYAELASQKGLGFALRVDDAVPARVLGDALRLRQILVNFLGNALKFTAAGSVTLAAAPDGDGHLRLSVADTGPGIEADVGARLFEPFSQGDGSTTRRFGGTGLGLAICRQLATLLGGRIGVDSAPGQGSEFWVQLPLPSVAAAAAPAAAAPAAADELRGRHVLVVEDNPVNLLIAEALLQRWGVTVATAADGRAALAAVTRQRATGAGFDAVLMDLQMPVMGGVEATRILRCDHDRDALPIIALTATALCSEQAACLEAGMNDFVAKPFDAERLRAVLARWMPPRAAAGR